jgi:hypothetical protein
MRSLRRNPRSFRAGRMSKHHSGRYGGENTSRDWVEETSGNYFDALGLQP